MAYTASHGPPLLDATHQWNPAAAADPPLLNDINTEPIDLPQIAVLACTGWRDAPEIVDNRAPRTFGVGEVVYPARVLGKTLVYECEIQSDDRLDMMTLQMGVVIGFGDRSAQGVMTVTPWPAPGGVAWTYTALVTDVKFDPAWKLDGESQITYRWGFTITLRMADPLFYTGGTGYP